MSLSKTILRLGIYLGVILLGIHNAWAQQPEQFGPKYEVKPKQLTIAPNLNLSSDESVKGNTLTLTDKTYLAIRGLSFNISTGFAGDVDVVKGKHCDPLTTDNSCTVTVTANGPDNTAAQPGKLFIYNDSGASVKKVDLTVKRPQLRIADNAITAQTKSQSYQSSRLADKQSSSSVTLVNDSDVAARITDASLPPSSDHGLICTGDDCVDDTGDNICSGSSQASQQGGQASADNDLLKPGDQCTIKLQNIASNAWGSGKLTVKGNLPGGKQIFPVNAAPTQILFASPTGDNNKCPAYDSVKSLLPYSQVPQKAYKAGVVCVVNRSNIPMHGLISLSVASGGSSDDFTFDVTSGSGSKAENGSCSKKFIPAHATCKVAIHNNGAQAGEEGNLIVTGKNVLNKRQVLPFGLQGNLLVLPASKRYLSHQFNGQQLPGTGFARVDLLNTSQDSIAIDDINIVLGADKDAKLIPSDEPDTEHVTSCDIDGMSLAAGEQCQVWFKTKSGMTPDIGYKDQDLFRVDYELPAESDPSTTKTWRVDLPIVMRTYLIAGGDFTSVNNQANTGYLAKYGPEPDDFESGYFSWSPVVPGIRGDINHPHAIVNTIKQADNGNLYFGGEFRHSNLPIVPKINDDSSTTVNHVCGATAGSSSNSNAFVGTACNVALFDGGLWHHLQQANAEGVDGPVNTIEPASDGKVYIGGEFVDAGIQHHVGNIILWQIRQGIHNWYPLGPEDVSGLTGVGGTVNALLTRQTNTNLANGDGRLGATTEQLLVGGLFDRAGDKDDDVNNNALWNNQRQLWTTNATGLGKIDAFDDTKPRIASLIHFDNTTYAGGIFNLKNESITVNSIAQQNGNSWHWPQSEKLVLVATDGVDGPPTQVRTLAKLTQNGSDKLLWVGGVFRAEFKSKKSSNLALFNKQQNKWLDVGSPVQTESDKFGPVNSVVSKEVGGQALTLIAGEFDKVEGSKKARVAYQTGTDIKAGSWKRLCELQPNASDDCDLMTFQNGDIHTMMIATMLNAAPTKLPEQVSNECYNEP